MDDQIGCLVRPMPGIHSNPMGDVVFSLGASDKLLNILPSLLSVTSWACDGLEWASGPLWFSASRVMRVSCVLSSMVLSQHLGTAVRVPGSHSLLGSGGREQETGP